jgi:biopolymer transport protein ExbB/TolQ
MLGLAGTIIPLGPALQSLLGGDMASMVNHLVVGFGAVVCGLVLSGAAYGITLVRERWARVDLKEMENLCELVMRVRRPQAVERMEVAHARVHS